MIVLLGPSGCGKTTTLRMIAGFVEATDGEIILQDRPISALPPHRREMGMVFQNYALFPHLTVARNIAFGLEMRRLSASETSTRVAEMLRLVKLDRFADRLPRQLSGGQQQRVAIARALAIHPKVLLLDEPLSNLDAELRQDVAREIRLLQQRGGADHHHGDPRPAGGDGHGRPPGGDARRPHPAGRHARRTCTSGPPPPSSPASSATAIC